MTVLFKVARTVNKEITKHAKLAKKATNYEVKFALYVKTKTVLIAIILYISAKLVQKGTLKMEKEVV